MALARELRKSSPSSSSNLPVPLSLFTCILPGIFHGYYFRSRVCVILDLLPLSGVKNEEEHNRFPLSTSTHSILDRVPISGLYECSWLWRSCRVSNGCEGVVCLLDVEKKDSAFYWPSPPFFYMFLHRACSHLNMCFYFALFTGGGDDS